MKIAAAQTIPINGDIQKNLDDHCRITKLAADKGASLILFPEMSLTGYQLEDARSLAFEKDDARLTPLQQIAAYNNITIIAGAPVSIDDKLYIGAFIIQPAGDTLIYTKRYLHDGEELFFEPGLKHNPALELDGQKIAIAICADIANPLHALHAAESGTTLYLAGIFCTPKGIRVDHKHLKEYSTTYKMHVLMANYGGPSYGMLSGGRSAAWDVRGQLIEQLDTTGEGLLITTI